MAKQKAILILSLFGGLFAGYLSGTKLFSQTCAFGEACPYFFGYPACYFSFVMYLVLFALSILLVLRKLENRKTINRIIFVSFLGILFAGYYTLAELPLLFSQGLSAYVLGLPTCALGLIFYLLIFIFALRARV